jgi:hypothetical protein
MRLIAVISVLVLISGCAISIDGSRYQEIEPEFNLQEFFQGRVKAWGIVQDRSGELIQRFEVTIDGSLKNGQLVLDETFTYGVGEGVEKRIWTIEETAAGVYQGGAGDIRGEASGKAYGNAMFWTYEMDLPVEDTTYRVSFDDWIWAFDETTIVNRSYIKKFGLVMAEVTIFMQKQ